MSGKFKLLDEVLHSTILFYKLTYMNNVVHSSNFLLVDLGFLDIWFCSSWLIGTACVLHLIIRYARQVATS